MCGLAGLLLPTPRQDEAALRAHAVAMADALTHRGPDDAGSWVDAAAGIALAHRRLAIVDLSTHGHQPMVSADSRYALAYNGEIYNTAELCRAFDIDGEALEGHSDTEVLLAAIATVGLEHALQVANGMYALALWDRHERCLWLARDRVGKKPLYYGWAGDTLVFGSELKALWRHPAFDNDVDPAALALLLRLDYIPAPHCIHRHAFKMQPGCLLRLDAAAVAAGAAAHDPQDAQQRFWDARQRMRAALAKPFAGDVTAAEDALDQALRQAVTRRMVADVPVGVFLSGGTDSSTVTAMMQAQSSRPVASFSIGFEGSHHDEAPLAREVAGHLGTDHTELYVSGRDALAVVPRLPEIFDEPFADASAVPTTLLAQLARRDVTVALSGDGGDELFLGYKRYRRALRNWNTLRRLPLGLRKVLAGPNPGEAARMGGLAALRAELPAAGIGAVYRNRVTRWRRPEALLQGTSGPACAYDNADLLDGSDAAAAMMLADFLSYLPDDLLCKVDRTTMAVSLEARTPLLDWQVVELAWSLPQALKWHEGTSKYLLKRVLQRYLPAGMVHRPKRGFGAPVSAWLRGDLHDWAGDLLAADRLHADGFLDANTIGQVWHAFDAGDRKWHTHLWNVLMFQAWLAHWRAFRAGHKVHCAARP